VFWFLQATIHAVLPIPAVMPRTHTPALRAERKKAMGHSNKRFAIPPYTTDSFLVSQLRLSNWPLSPAHFSRLCDRDVRPIMPGAGFCTASASPPPLGIGAVAYPLIVLRISQHLSCGWAGKRIPEISVGSTLINRTANN